VLQQCGPPASFSNIQTAINKDQPANPTEGKSSCPRLLTNRERVLPSRARDPKSALLLRARQTVPPVTGGATEIKP